MTQASIEAQVSLCHSAYQKLTGFTLPIRSLLDMRRQAWQRLIAAGYTAADVELVILHLKSEIRAGRRFPGCLRFRNLVEDSEHFQEEVSMAKARNRKRPPSAKESVLAMARPTVEERTPAPDAVKTTASIIPGLLAEMRKAVENQKA